MAADCAMRGKRFRPSTAGGTDVSVRRMDVGADRVGQTVKADHLVSLVVVKVKSALLFKAHGFTMPACVFYFQCGIQTKIVVQTFERSRIGRRGVAVGKAGGFDDSAA